ncbi:DUF4166 domain-containing protein [Microbacterium sp. YY-01]|uniref:DUF4166 domain-containing protein n=1 Tax=Microbacterium sp. YY-01 TaxID=3421634 RepID=UPI003D163689
MPAVPRSPYVRVLGERIHRLHPELRAYFGPLPHGAVGRGEGVFHTAGTRKVWLRPLLNIFARRGVVFGGWATEIPFTVENRSIASRRLAERTFHLPRGAWTMRDAIVAGTGGTLIDELGEPGLVRASFSLAVEHGDLLMTSTAMGLRWGRLRLTIPRWIAPRIRITEAWDDAVSQQHISLTVDMPIMGRIYEYDGHFTYRVEQETHD